jgi:hypothetical protein
MLWWLRRTLCAGLLPMNVDGWRKVFSEEEVMQAFSNDIKPLVPLPIWKRWPTQLTINWQIRRWKRRVRFTDALCDILAHAMTLDSRRLRERVDEMWRKEALEEFEA